MTGSLSIPQPGGPRPGPRWWMAGRVAPGAAGACILPVEAGPRRLDRARGCGRPGHSAGAQQQVVGLPGGVRGGHGRAASLLLFFLDLKKLAEIMSPIWRLRVI